MKLIKRAGRSCNWYRFKMGKLPSFQFYPGDWLKDLQLRMPSMSSKGIWIDLLCAMFEAKERGALEATTDQFCKLLGCPREEFDLFLSEAQDLNFASVCEMSADCPQAIRIEFRRMLRDEKIAADLGETEGGSQIWVRYVRPGPAEEL